MPTSARAALVGREIVVSLPALHRGQAEVYRDTARFRVLIAGRRFGKTVMGSVSTLDAGPEPFDAGALFVRSYASTKRETKEVAMLKKNPTLRRASLAGGRIWWVAPVYHQAKIGWRSIVHLAEQVPGCEIQKSTMTAEFPGGGTVTVKSAHDPDRLRGEGLDGVVLEEAAYLRPSVWPSIIRPALTDRQGWALFISTPAGRNWLADLFDFAGTQPNWSRFQMPSVANPRIPAAELEDARSGMPEMLYQQEHEARFIDAMGSLFKPEWFRYYMAERDERTGHWWLILFTDGGEKRYRLQDCRRWMAIDPALSVKASADFTAMVVGAETPEGHLCILDVVRQRMEQPDLIPAAAALYRKWRVEYAAVEAKGLGLGVFQAMRNVGGMHVIPSDMRGDKLQKATPVAMRMKAAHLSGTSKGGVFFDSEGGYLRDLQTEMLAFTGEPVPADQQGSDHAAAHDDQVDALAILDSDRFVLRAGPPRIRSLDG